ncbi:MAG: hypothetical protein VW644_01170 [Alphaproteobacteria bacterium]|jgi:CMP-N,N'-diacetyllegionaminic acid synthase
MSWRGRGGALSVLAVVPARGGSKGLPGKNLRHVGGISLVGRAARLAASVAWIDHAVLSTDDPVIAAEGARHGLDVPFMRPDVLASDAASSADLAATMESLVAGGHRSAATVSPTPAHFTPHKTLTVDDDGRVGFYRSDGAGYATRQRIPSFHHRNGLCYAVTRAALVEDGEIIGNDCAAVVIDRPVVNIDDAFELEMAEWLLAREGTYESVATIRQIA